MYYINAASEF